MFVLLLVIEVCCCKKGIDHEHEYEVSARVRGEGREKLLAEVRQVYAELATRPLERACQRIGECCQFRLTGLTPYLTKGEALVSAKAWRATGRKKLPNDGDGNCPMLERTSGRCLVYADRPFACRTHFCAAAGGPMERREVLDLIRRLETVDAQLGGDGPRKLAAAVAAALGEIA